MQLQQTPVEKESLMERPGKQLCGVVGVEGLTEKREKHLQNSK